MVSKYEKSKEDAVFLRTGFCNWKKALTSFRDHQSSKCLLAALTFEVTVPQYLDVVAIANLFAESKDHKKRMFGNNDNNNNNNNNKNNNNNNNNNNNKVFA